MDTPLELRIWRAVGPQDDLRSGLAAALAALPPRLAPDCAVLRYFVPERRLWETLAVAGSRAKGTYASVDRLADSAAPGLSPRLRADGLVLESAQVLAHQQPGVLPAGVKGSVAVAVICGEPQLTAVLLLIGLREPRLAAPLRGAVQSLRDPLSAALRNEIRLREAAALREMAEADRRSLLSRLGRTDIAETIVGADGGLRDVMERVAQVAQSDAPVLLLGETGSGKEVVARAIHRGSSRAEAPFLRVNCGAIPGELIDSELFGHERGSFTGAVAQRKGWFERADGGTLFMDEVADLPLAAQVRLLRVLQDGLVQRVGAEQTIAVDVRIIAATNQDLRAMMRQGRFREDLWYRLAVFPIQLPALRDRAGDVPALAAHFARRAAAKLGLAPCLPGEDDIRLLFGYEWPGNIRELASVIERAAILGNGRRLEVAKALGAGAAVPGPDSSAWIEAPAPIGVPGFATLDAQSRVHIEAALRKCLGRVEGPFGAALLLGLNAQTLRSRMKKLGIDAAAFRARALRA